MRELGNQKKKISTKCGSWLPEVEGAYQKLKITIKCGSYLLSEEVDSRELKTNKCFFIGIVFFDLTLEFA